MSTGRSSGSVNLFEFEESSVASLSSGLTGVIATMTCLIYCARFVKPYMLTVGHVLAFCT